MSARITPELPPPLAHYLAQGAPALLLTAGADGYATSMYTWAVGLDSKRVRFAVDADSSGLANLRRSGLASLHIIGPGGLEFLVKGIARPLKDRLEAAGDAVMLVYEMAVVGAKDQSWPGVESAPLRYLWPEDTRDAMSRMEQSVYAEMRAA